MSPVGLEDGEVFCRGFISRFPAEPFELTTGTELGAVDEAYEDEDDKLDIELPLICFCNDAGAGSGIPFAALGCWF